MSKKKNEVSIVRSSAAEYLTFVATTGDNEDSVEMRYEDENIWLTQKMMAQLYDVSVAAINQHIKKIFEDNELDENSVIKKYLITAADGKKYNTNHYNLQMIIAVGFKVNNERAVQFRKWANGIVKDYTIQGWVMDDERLKNGGTVLTQEYFEKQLEKGILVPANKDVVLKIFKELDNVKKFDSTSNAVNDFKTFVASLPKQIEFEEVATKKKATTTPTADHDEFADASEESLEIYNEATALAEKENIDFKDALLKLNKGV